MDNNTVLQLQDILTDTEILLCLDEKEKTIKEIKEINKEKRNKKSSDLDERFKAKAELESELNYYNTILSLASDERIKSVNNSIEDDEKKTENNNSMEHPNSIIDKIISKIMNMICRKIIREIITS